MFDKWNLFPDKKPILHELLECEGASISVPLLYVNDECESIDNIIIGHLQLFEGKYKWLNRKNIDVNSNQIRWI